MTSPSIWRTIGWTRSQRKRVALIPALPTSLEKLPSQNQRPRHSKLSWLQSRTSLLSSSMCTRMATPSSILSMAGKRTTLRSGDLVLWRYSLRSQRRPRSPLAHSKEQARRPWASRSEATRTTGLSTCLESLLWPLRLASSANSLTSGRWKMLALPTTSWWSRASGLNTSTNTLENSPKSLDHSQKRNEQSQIIYNNI